MTLRARAGKCCGAGFQPAPDAAAGNGECPAGAPNERSFSSADSATAPKPLAQRRSMSRRLRGGVVKRPQCMSVKEDKLLDVEQHVGEVGPRPQVVHPFAG